jgi:hypothetical protein
MTASFERDDTSTAETMALRTPDGVWYELHHVNAERAAELDAVTAGTDDVAGFNFYTGELWHIGGNQRQWHVAKITGGPDGKMTITPTVTLEPPPSVGFPDGATYRA